MMDILMKKYLSRAGTLLAALALSACAASTGVNNDGTPAGSVVWPEPSNVNFDGGSYPALDNVRKVGDGMTKDQLYELIGRPQFHEGFITSSELGLAGVHEWDYLFNFPTSGSVLQCQYKVLFDSGMLARTFLWNPESCESFVFGGNFTLSGDALFSFDSADLTAEGKTQLAELADKLRTYGDVPVQVVGYTDRIGPDSYNRQLSERRARSVRNELVVLGIDPDQVDAVGRGNSDPVVHCSDARRDELITCLAPNRRVEVNALIHQHEATAP